MQEEFFKVKAIIQNFSLNFDEYHYLNFIFINIMKNKAYKKYILLR